MRRRPRGPSLVDARCLRYESLEDRRLLAVYTVDSAADSGPGTLRDAIEQANASQGVPDEIVFTPALSGQTIELTTGRLVVTDPLTIDGSSLADDVTIDGGNWSHTFGVEAESVVLRQLSLTGGREATVQNTGDLTLDGVTIYGSELIGLSNAGDVLVENSLFHDIGAAVRGSRSAINNEGFASIRDTTFSNELGEGRIQGHLLDTYYHLVSEIGSEEWLTIERSTFVTHQSYGVDGGDVYDLAAAIRVHGSPSFSSPAATLSDSLVDGAIEIERSLFFGDSPLQGDYNLFTDDSGSLVEGEGNTAGANPRLGPLAFNGGRTRTHAPLPGSPAIDAGNPLFVGVDATDQRGEPYARVADGGSGVARLDLGAHEAQAEPTSAPGDFNGDGLVNAADYTLYRDQLGSMVDPLTGADATGDGLVDDADRDVWSAHYGDTPIGSSIVVNRLGHTDDFSAFNNQTTLLEAIRLANTFEGIDTITFDPSLSGGVISLLRASNRSSKSWTT